MTTLFDSVACSSPNSVWGAFTVEVLARLGVETMVTSPGSRSTPLTFAAARSAKMESLSILDERSAAFFALGLAKRTWRPVALVCTSGSAAANYLPAVVEASMSCVPLLLLTADRPPEMRDCCSGQTIDQLNLYGKYVRSFREIALPETSEEMLSYLRQSLVHAVSTALGHDPGPVHLNFPFRDPLVPVNGVEVIEPSVLEAAATVLTRPCEAVEVGGAIDAVAVERLTSHQHGIIVVGDINPRGDPYAFVEAVATLSNRLGWPVLADVLNPLRSFASKIPDLVTHYERFLRKPEALHELAPSAVLQVGPLPTSKTLRQWLSKLDAVSFLMTPRSINIDPLHRVASVIPSSVEGLTEVIGQHAVDDDWLERWNRFEGMGAEEVFDRLGKSPKKFEGRIVRLISMHLPEGASVFVASSMCIRYAEYFWRKTNGHYAIYGNRGANGIDGTLGTALGLAHRGQPAFLLTGDLAFLHDSNALLAASRMKGSLTVILINNEGGGIFENLPIAQQDPPFEDYFATPQAVDFEILCSAHGIAYSLLESIDELIPVINATHSSGVSVFEFRSDRKADSAALQSILA